MSEYRGTGSGRGGEHEVGRTLVNSPRGRTIVLIDEGMIGV